MNQKVQNSYGVMIDEDVAVMLMDDELREMLHIELAPCTAQEFFTKYCEEHIKKFGEEFELDKENPIY